MRRFLSTETARSLQTSHGRLIRLGLVAAAASAGTLAFAKGALSSGLGASALADAAVAGSSATSAALKLKGTFLQLARGSLTPSRAQQALFHARDAAERMGLRQVVRLDSSKYVVPAFPFLSICQLSTFCRIYMQKSLLNTRESFLRRLRRGSHSHSPAFLLKSTSNSSATFWWLALRCLVGVCMCP